MYSVQCTVYRCRPVSCRGRRTGGYYQGKSGVVQGITFANIKHVEDTLEDYRGCLQAVCVTRLCTGRWWSLVVSVHCRWRNCARAGGSRGSGGQAGDQDTACNTHTATHHTGQYRHTAVTRLYQLTNLHTQNIHQFNGKMEKDFFYPVFKSSS